MEKQANDEQTEKGGKRAREPLKVKHPRLALVLGLAILALASCLFLSLVRTIRTNVPAKPVWRRLKSEDVEKKMGRRNYVVLEMIPHDVNLFTQGLTYANGKLFESTGMYGESRIRQVDISNGATYRSTSLDNSLFGEGLAHFHDQDGIERLILITWKSRRGFVYDADTFEVVTEFSYDTKTGEGWGITYDPINEEFVVSDGSEWIYFWDRDSLKETKRVQVVFPIPNSEERKFVDKLNELEYVNGRILANIWYADIIISINPLNGIVEKIYDFSDLYKNRLSSADCFNGISVTGVEGELFVTGKLWPHMYRIKLLW